VLKGGILLILADPSTLLLGSFESSITTKTIALARVSYA
jgi:hypothetical protein